MPDPIGSIYYDYFKTGKIPKDGNCNYFLGGNRRRPLAKAMDFSVIDDVVQVKDQDAFHVARLLACKGGILAGGSSGANVWAAIRTGEEVDKAGTIVAMLPDGGIKYLSKIYR